MTAVAAEVTREILWNVPDWARALLYVLAAVATAICVHGVVERARAWRRGRAHAPRGDRSSALEQARRAARRLWDLAVLQRRILRSGQAGLAHLGITYGFIVLFIGTCIVALEEWGARALGVEHWFFTGTFYLVVSCALEVFGLAFVLGVVLALLRRRSDSRHRPLARATDAAILWLFLVIGVSGFVVEALRIAAAEGSVAAHPFEGWSFVGWALALGLEPLGDAALREIHLVAWLLHMVLSMAFVAILPYCKLRHVLFAPLSIALSEPRVAGAWDGVPLEEVEATGRYGATVAADFSRRRLLSFDACTECARCQSACPAWATGKPLSPMDVVVDIARASAYESPDRALGGDLISADAIWACTTCGACVEECPVAIDQLAAIVELRRGLVGEGEIRGNAQAVLGAVGAAENPWGLPAEERVDWTRALEEEGIRVPVIGESPDAELLYWVGCAASYDRRARKVAIALVRILHAAGVRFAILGREERCTGDPARRLGDEFTYTELATRNVETLDRAAPKRIVTACPHCLHTLRNEYPDLGGRYEVVHHTELIDELLRAGRLELEDAASEAGGPGRVTYHDPCYLARIGGVVEAPRAVLRRAASEPAEPALARERGFCCGAGGGRMWVEETAGSRVNDERLRQLEETRPDTVAVGCPFCLTMLGDAAATRERGPEILDVAEIVASRLRPA